jgi:hypothetical protein
MYLSTEKKNPLKCDQALTDANSFKRTRHWIPTDESSPGCIHVPLNDANINQARMHKVIAALAVTLAIHIMAEILGVC